MFRSEPVHLHYARNDVLAHKGVSTALLLLLILSAFFMTTGAMVMERVVGSVDQLFEEAKPPHFLQMHSGDYDQQALGRFAAEHPEVEAWQVQEMTGFDGAAISFHRGETGEPGDFAESLIDHLFVTQNPEFDLLIDAAGDVPRPQRGQVYLPVAYQDQFALQVDDELIVDTTDGPVELSVAGFIRDAQMASSLSSATRLLVSEADFTALQQAGGAGEIIVGYRLIDPGGAAQFQREYEAAQGLPMNGQAVTFQMIRMINALGDGLVAIALMFVSQLLIAIALLNVRFVIRGSLAGQVHQIGAMKAIGLPPATIRGLFLAKYRVLTLLACVIGGVLAVPATNLLTRTVQSTYAEARPGPATALVAVLALLAVYLFVIALCRGVLRALRRVEVVGALVHGSLLGERQQARRAARAARRVGARSLASYRGAGVGRRLAVLNLRAEARQWVLLPVVFLLATVLMTLPMNVLSTFESPRFGTYLGAAQADLRADVQFGQNLNHTHDELLRAMAGDERLNSVRSLATVPYQAEGAQGWQTLRVQVGDHGGSIELTEGALPRSGQIALSVLNAEQYQVTTGDELTIGGPQGQQTVTVSGVYQDVTSGGYTAKMQGQAPAEAEGYTIYADVDDADPQVLAAEYGAAFPAVTVVPMQQYLQQTLAHVTGSFTSAAVLAFIFGLGVAMGITCLFLTLQLARDRQQMGVLSALGFSTGELITQVRAKTLIAVLTGTVLGVLIAATAGEWLVSAALAVAGLGITELSFISNPWLVYLAYPLILTTAGLLSVVVLTNRLRGTDRSSWLITR